MAKISTFKGTLTDSSSSQHSVTFDIFYTSKEGFFAVIPEQYKSIIDTLGLPESSVFKRYKSRSDRFHERPNYDYIVHGSSEQIAEDKTKDILRKVLGASTVERRVIMIYYEARIGDRFSNVNTLNSAHPMLNSSYGLCYAVEVMSSTGAEPQYFVETTHPHPSEGSKVRRSKVYTRGAYVLIDDTPENREFLEKLYTMLQNLNTRLADFMRTTEGLTNFIQSGEANKLKALTAPEEPNNG